MNSCRINLCRALVAGLSLVAAAPAPLLAAPSDVDANTVQRNITPPMADPVQSGTMTPAASPPSGARTPGATGKEREPRGNPLWAIPLRLLNATRERPIFLPSRRPPAPAVAGPPPVQPVTPPPPAEPDRPRLVLVGAIAGETEGFAVFVDDATKDIVRLKTGESHEGWTLRLVRGREATLEKNSETVILAIPAPGEQKPPKETDL